MEAGLEGGVALRALRVVQLDALRLDSALSSMTADALIAAAEPLSLVSALPDLRPRTPRRAHGSPGRRGGGRGWRWPCCCTAPRSCRTVRRMGSGCLDFRCGPPAARPRSPPRCGVRARRGRGRHSHPGAQLAHVALAVLVPWAWRRGMERAFELSVARPEFARLRQRLMLIERLVTVLGCVRRRAGGGLEPTVVAASATRCSSSCTGGTCRWPIGWWGWSSSPPKRVDGDPPSTLWPGTCCGTVRGALPRRPAAGPAHAAAGFAEFAAFASPLIAKLRWLRSARRALRGGGGAAAAPPGTACRACGSDPAWGAHRLGCGCGTVCYGCAAAAADGSGWFDCAACGKGGEMGKLQRVNS